MIYCDMVKYINQSQLFLYVLNIIEYIMYLSYVFIAIYDNFTALKYR